MTTNFTSISGDEDFFNQIAGLAGETPSMSTAPTSSQVSLPPEQRVKETTLGGLITKEDKTVLPPPSTEEMSQRIAETAANQPLPSTPVKPPKPAFDVTQQTQRAGMGEVSDLLGGPDKLPTYVPRQRTTESMSPVDIKPLLAAQEKLDTETMKVTKKEQENAQIAAQQQQLAIEAQDAAYKDYLSSLDTEAKKVRDATVEKQKLVDEAKTNYENAAVQNRGFWAIADTPKKLSSAFSLLSAAAFAFARQPDRANAAIDKADSIIKETIDADLKQQEANKARLKEILGMRQEDFKNTRQLLRDDMQDNLARKLATIEVADKMYKNTETWLQSQNLKIDRIAQKRAELDKQKQEILVKNAEGNRTKTVTIEEAKAKVLPPTTIMQEMATKAPSEQLQMVEKANKNAIDLANSPEVKSLGSIKQAQNAWANAVARAKKDPNDTQGLSVLQGQFIAEGMMQASFGTDLRDQMMADGLIEKVQGGYRWVTGQAGRISLGTAETILGGINRIVQSKEEDPNTFSMYKNYESAVQNARTTNEVYNALSGRQTPSAGSKMNKNELGFTKR